jgi:RNA polymerase sigma-70 factor (ECF subfamily)
MSFVIVCDVLAISFVDERAICERFAGRIRTYGLRHLRDEQAACDLVQQVLLAVIEAVRQGRVEDPARLDAFVLGTARNISWDMRRFALRQSRVAEKASVGLPEGWEPAWPRVEGARLEHCLGELEARERAIVMMTFAEDRTADEIASALSLSAGNVRVIRHRALASLRTCVEGGAR